MAKAAKSRRRTPARRSRKSGGMGTWLFLGLLVVGSILIYENRSQAAKMAGLYNPFQTRAAARTVTRQTDQPVRRKVEREVASLGVPTPGQRPRVDVRAQEPAFTGTWYLCASRTDNCVIDGATIIHRGQKIRIADIVTPETIKAKCEDERRRGMAARMRLRELLNEGPFTEIASPERGPQSGGLKPRLLVRNGTSLGQRLVSEGLAKRWTGKRASWCGQA